MIKVSETEKYLDNKLSECQNKVDDLMHDKSNSNNW